MKFNNDSLFNGLEENLTANRPFAETAHDHEDHFHKPDHYPIDFKSPIRAARDYKLNSTATGLVSSEIVPASSLSQSEINSLLSGSSWPIPASRVLTYSFYESSVWNGDYYSSETGVTEVSEAVKTNVRQILNWLETVINIDFQEVTETSRTSPVGTLRYMLSNNPGYAYAYYPSTFFQQGGDVHLNPGFNNSSSGNGFERPAGNHGYMSLIHETLHALGLKHPHESPALTTIDDNTANTVMSYRFTGNSAGTAMAYDIAALQSLYGTKAKETGNTSYQFTTRIDQFSVNNILSIDTTFLTKQTIWDTGGIDTLDFSNLAFESLGYRLDMSAGGWLTANRAYRFERSIGDPNVTRGTILSTYYDFGTSIAYNVTLENLVNSTSSDTIFANDAANQFRGYTNGRSVGADILWNTNSNDTLDLSTYSINAVTRTQNGNDLMLGLGTNGSITVKDYYTSPLSILYSDVILPEISLAVTPASVTEDSTDHFIYTFTRTGDLSSSLTVNFNVSGTSVFNTDYSQTGAASYTNTNGSIIFNIGAETATLTLSPVDDTVAEYDETIGLTLASNANYLISTLGAVTSTILNDDVPTNLTSITFTLNTSAVAENASPNLIYTFTRTGGNLTNPLTVNFSVDGTAILNTDYTVLGSSSFSATTGSVTFAANSTTASITIDPRGDTTVEDHETVGLTLLPSFLDYTIATSTTVTGTLTNDDGNALDNTLLGGTANDNLNGLEGNDTIIGNAGNDTLNGGIGSDSLNGGLGNDSYFIDNVGDIIIENVGEGTDLVQSSITFDLTGTNLENLTLIGTVNINGTGNSNNNTLTGNAANNTLTGGQGNDQLNGGVGVDTLIGGLGNDSYTVDNIADVCVESAGEGVDTLSIPFNFNLTGTNIENLTLTGTGNINGTGDSSNNTLTGNTGNNILTGDSGADRLTGGNGNDRLVGGSGNDTLTGGAGNDTYVFSSLTDGNDRITDFSVVDDLIQISASGFGGNLALGTPNAALLRVGAGVTTANTAEQRLIYNTSTGALFFDADGNGISSNPSQFATLSTNLALVAADFVVV